MMVGPQNVIPAEKGKGLHVWAPLADFDNVSATHFISLFLFPRL